MRLSINTALLGLLASLTTPAYASQQPNQSDKSQKQADTEIVVTGAPELEDEEVRDAVDDLAMKGRAAPRPLVKFQAPLCIHVSGLGDAGGQAISKRIQANTLDAGFLVGEAGCEVNALVVVVDDPPALVKALRKSQPKLFNVHVSRRIKSAIRQNRASFDWSTTRLQVPQGRDIQAESLGLADPSGDPVRIRSTWPSRLEIPYSLERVNSVIVFDSSRLDGVSFRQLADYATMRILGQPQPKVELESGSASTILSLFDAEPTLAPQELSQLDRAYLRGLYAMKPNDRASRLESFVLAAYEEVQAESCIDEDGQDQQAVLGQLPDGPNERIVYKCGASD